MASSLIKLNLAKRTAVVHWESYSQSTHKRASPHSQTGGLHHKHRFVLLQIQFLRHPLYQWDPLDASDSNTRGKNNKRAATVALWARGAYHQGCATFRSAGSGESQGPSLRVPSLLLCKYCPSSCPWPLLVLVPHPSPPEINADHPIWSQVQSSREGFSWALPG